MRTLSTGRYLGIVFGIGGCVVGFGSHGVEWAVLGLLFGFFLGKSVQSLLWTVTAGPAS